MSRSERAKRTLAAAVAAGGLLSLAGSVQAANYTWNGISGATWDVTSTNWTGTPTGDIWNSSNVAYLNQAGGGTINVSGNLTAYRLWQTNTGATGGYTLSSPNLTDHSLTLTGGVLSNTSGKPMTISTALKATTAALSIAGDFVLAADGSFNSPISVGINVGSAGTTPTSVTQYGNATISSTLAVGGMLGTTEWAVKGGTLTVNNNRLQLGGATSGSVGKLSIDGGTVLHTAPAGIGLQVGYGSAATGIVDLKSGVLASNLIVRGYGTATANFNITGGTVQPYNANLPLGSATAANNFDITLTGSGGIISSTDYVNSGTLRVVSVYSKITGNHDLTFAGSGTTVLYAASDYIGTTIVSSGAVKLNNSSASLSSSSSLFVKSGALFQDLSTARNVTFAALKGTGSLAANAASTFVASGVEPGDTANGIGTLKITAGGLSLTGGSAGSFKFDIADAGGTSDQITVAGTGTAVSTNALKFSDFAFAGPGVWTGSGPYSYKLIDGAAAGGVTLDSNAANLTGAIGTAIGVLSVNSGDLMLTVTVPEPASLGLLALGAPALLVRRRRR